MNDTEMKQKIKISIQAFQKSGASEAVIRLFQTLGYNTSRQNPFSQKTYSYFKESFLAGDTRFNEDRALVKDWQSVDLLFQLSTEEMKPQHGLFDTRQVDRTIIETYLFFAIELTQAAYSRTTLAQITREINKIFPMPVMVLFKYGSSLTLAVIDRRLHKRDERKDVLEKVTLIKDISIEQPHRAHVEILFDLSFDELLRKYKFTNFVELHNAWQKTLDTKELNKRFFKELANWYLYSQQWVSFPKDKRTTEEKNIQLHLIRLITRLIFVWFLKEKKLIRDEIFNVSFLKNVVKDFDPNSETAKNFYPAMLQNLFFATLNQHSNKRDFARDDDKFNKADQGVKSLYRYPEKFIISKKEVIELFKDVPFLNGGLFDCLDRFDEEKLEKGIKDQIFVDGFTRIEKHIPVVPDFLFFGSKANIDLTSFYGDKKRQKEQFKGLISIFDDYKFTIEENTPIEEEIALDPELLGKVFENLLAYYTPETETTARKQTGSFYTPREIVNYMVDESLVAYLKNQLLNINPAFVEFGKSQIKLFGNEVSRDQLAFNEALNRSRWQGKEPELENALRRMIHYNNDHHPFSEAEVQQLIFAIDHCKILDPACGSGAFPMGMLHKLVYLLGKLDPEDENGNTRWRSLQKQKAEIAISEALNEKDKQQREQKLIEINDAFENNASDYGRKLYLIENFIYGVDIQPIAVQISKLRFFISLVVDQNEKPGAENRGIRPLPNLETKFVAANTLIGLEKPAQLPIGYEAIALLQKQLQDIRHQHFDAKTRQEKLYCQKKDKEIRKLISDKLIALGFPNNDALKIASFDIYDQNAAADWFEPEWMFGNDLKPGFDVVIGNPPYLRIQGVQETNPELVPYAKINYLSAAKGNWDLYVLFTEKGYQLLRTTGLLAFIQPHKFFQAEFGAGMRDFIAKSKSIYQIVHFGAEQMFESATNYTCLFFLQRQPRKDFAYISVKQPESWLSDTASVQVVRLPQPAENQKWTFASLENISVMEKLKRQPQTLGDITRKIFQGIATSADKIYVLQLKNWGKDTVLAFSNQLHKDVEIETGLVKLFLMGKDVKRYEKPAPKHVVIFPYRIENGKANLMNAEYIKKHFPLGWKYLSANRSELENREHGRMKHADFYAYIYPKNLTKFNAVKIITPEIAIKPQMSIDDEGTCYHTTKVCSFVFKDNIPENQLYWLGLLNSKLLWTFLSSTGYVLRGGYFTFKTEYLKPFPIRRIDFTKPDDKRAHDKICALVSDIMQAKQSGRESFRQETEIDALAFHLYGFTEQELLDALLQMPEVSEAERREIQAQYKNITR